jgi:hypothetical protein
VMTCQERHASRVLSHTTSQFFWLVDTCGNQPIKMS